jgi:ABC-type phosphate/phosphonate transport system permease subunit
LSTAATNGTVAWRLQQLERTVEQLERKVDRLVWALTVAALSFAGSAAVLVVVVLSGRQT